MYRRPYVESSVFIAYIKGEIKDAHDCKAVVDAILKAAEAGDFPICTSSLTIAEVFKTKKSIPLTDQENEDLRPYFRERYIRLIEVDRDIAERANELCRIQAATVGKKLLRPNDAIHLACAERANCEVLLSYDADLTQQTHDSIRIEWPQPLVVVPTQAALPAPNAIQASLALSAPAEEAEALVDEILKKDLPSEQEPNKAATPPVEPPTNNPRQPLSPEDVTPKISTPPA